MPSSSLEKLKSEKNLSSKNISINKSALWSNFAIPTLLSMRSNLEHPILSWLLWSIVKWVTSLHIRPNFQEKLSLLSKQQKLWLKFSRVLSVFMKKISSTVILNLKMSFWKKYIKTETHLTLDTKLLILVSQDQSVVQELKPIVVLKNIWPHKSSAIHIMEFRLIFGLWEFFITSWFLLSIPSKVMIWKLKLIEDVPIHISASKPPLVENNC